MITWITKHNRYHKKPVRKLRLLQSSHLCIPTCLMSSKFTNEVVTVGNFYQLSVLEFDVSVFEAILSIQKSFNLIEYRELIVKNSLFGNELN